MTNCSNYFWNAFNAHQDAPAIDIDKSTYTYGKLAGISDRIQSIVEKYSKSNIVAILSYKNVITYGGIIGTLSSGKAYCPIGHKLPIKRQLTVLEESRADAIILPNQMLGQAENLLHQLGSNTTIITDGVVSSEIKEAHPKLNIQSIDEIAIPIERKVRAINEDSLAYLLFTSGTTGKPKGVPITHKSLKTYLDNIEKQINIGLGLRFSQTFPLTFDLSVHDIFVCWRHLGCLVPIPESQMLSPAKFISEANIHIWFSVPSQISLLNKLGLLEPKSFSNIQVSLFCGEALPVDLAQKWMEAANQSEVYNLYGPTEATIAISLYKLVRTPNKLKSKNGVVSIGKLFNDHKYEIRDGELILIGPQIAENYWNNEQKFSSPFSNINGEPSYRTGDLVEIDDDLIYYLSRTDHQVKINGNRVELEEINTVIRKLIPNFAVHTVNINKSFGDALHVFVVSDIAFNETEVLKKLKDVLPGYMIPKAIHKIQNLPLNQSGKVDSNALKKRFNDAI